MTEPTTPGARRRAKPHPARRTGRRAAVPGLALPVVVGVLGVLAPAALAATIDGTARDDVLRGTARADRVDARGGDDVVTAGGGADVVQSGPGDDVVRLGPGADRLRNAAGADTVVGGDGDDVVEEVAVASLGDGDDRYLADNGGCVAVDLGRGADTVPRGTRRWYGGRDDCTLRGGPGPDLLSWSGYDGPEGPGLTVLVGGTGDDVLYGGYNDDVLLGGDGDDVIYGSEDLWNRSDVIDAGAGDDVVYMDGTSGGGPIDCGPGPNDIVVEVALPRELVGCEVVNP